MVFSSVPVYLDPPNWNQQSSHINQFPGSSTGVGGGIGGGELHQLQPPAVAAAPRPDGGMVVVSAGGGSARAPGGSMADRARQAKVPQPEPALKCPRCDSTNTKFCYFNNYSLTQPRHFCKTCRRYWTRGGALRNVPVGGGCRRNKRSKSSSKSSSSAAAAASGAATTSASTGGVAGGAISSNMPPLPPPQLPFMASLHSQMGDYGGGSVANYMGLNFGGIQTSIDPVDHYHHHVGSSSSVGLEQWRFQPVQAQFPFFAAAAGLETQPSSVLGLNYPFDGEGTVQVHGKPTAAGLITQLASVKMEDHNLQAQNMARQYLDTHGNDQYWSGGGGGGSSSGGGGHNVTAGGWTDLSGFNSSSTGHLL